MIARATRLGAALVLALSVAQPAAAQYAIGVGADYLGYAFDDGLGSDAAQLLMVPVAVRLPIANGLTFDVFGAWAEGRVEQNNQVLKLQGPVDAAVKAHAKKTAELGDALKSMKAAEKKGDEAQKKLDETIVARLKSRRVSELIPKLQIVDRRKRGKHGPGLGRRSRQQLRLLGQRRNRHRHHRLHDFRR